MTTITTTARARAALDNNTPAILHVDCSLSAIFVRNTTTAVHSWEKYSIDIPAERGNDFWQYLRLWVKGLEDVENESSAEEGKALDWGLRFECTELAIRDFWEKP